PALSETMQAVERQGLWPTDIEVWRLHYAQTLHHWRSRFETAMAQTPGLLDDSFIRMWRYYLIASELSFRLGRQVVFQMQLARQQDAVPLTRDYMAEERLPSARLWHRAEERAQPVMAKKARH
ncbi:MAG: class I SAM-dependent methyltransferase, partial [Rhodobacteraceae bacterium]|nr:class I SAM-dependent methyltransferase [Paracoccaceae bacterium]